MRPAKAGRAVSKIVSMNWVDPRGLEGTPADFPSDGIPCDLRDLATKDERVVLLAGLQTYGFATHITVPPPRASFVQ